MKKKNIDLDLFPPSFHDSSLDGARTNGVSIFASLGVIILVAVYKYFGQLGHSDFEILDVDR